MSPNCSSPPASLTTRSGWQGRPIFSGWAARCSGAVGDGPAQATAQATALAAALAAAAPRVVSRHIHWRRAVYCGLGATNLLNPKIGAFYVAMLPQFIPARAPHLLMGLTLAGVHDAEGITWFALLISAAHLARRFLDSDTVHKVSGRITGTVLIGFGLKLVLSK